MDIDKRPVTDIFITYDVALLTVDNLPNDMSLIAEIFSSIASKNINVDIISLAPPYRDLINLSFTISNNYLVDVIELLNSFKSRVPKLLVEVDADNTKLTVSGTNMNDTPGVAANLFNLLACNEIEVKMVTTSDTDISYVIYSKDVDKSKEAIMKLFKL